MKLLYMPARLGRTSEETSGVQDSRMGVLPQIWATAGNLAHALLASDDCSDAEGMQDQRARSAPVFRTVLAPQTAFYRSYTEALLRKFAVLSLESGRVPSMLGREMFRGKVTSYRVHAFDDVVIFVHDVDQCLRLLTVDQQRVILRVAVQEYTFAETAAVLQLSLRTVQRRFNEAVDELTTIFLQRRLLERIATDPCQGTGRSAKVVTHSPI